MKWLKKRWEKWKVWAGTESPADGKLGIILSTWALALAMGGGTVFRSGITLDAVISFGGYLICGIFIWGIWAAAFTMISREKANLRRLCALALTLLIFTAFASQIQAH